MKITNEGGPQSKSFWQTLRGNKRKQEIYSLKDPISDEIINDGKKIKNCVLYYWRTLGKMNRELTNKNSSISTHNVKEMVNHFRLINNSNDVNNMNKDYLDRIYLTIDKVSSAISNSKNNKSPGIVESIMNY